MKMGKMAVLLFAVFLGGCTTVTSKLTAVEWSNDAALQKSARMLAEDYLKDQAGGGVNASDLFSAGNWSGVVNFSNLHEWKITGTKLIKTMPAIRCRIKAENAMGGVQWATYGILMDYDKSLRDKKDKYNGLRIFAVMETPDN